MFGLLAPDVQITVTINGNPNLEEYRRSVTSLALPAFMPGDIVTGKLEIGLVKGKTTSHQGIHLILFGEYRTKTGEFISRFYERVQHIRPVGELKEALSEEFKYDKLNFPTNSYYGHAFDAVYGIEVKIIRRLKDYSEKSDFIVFIFTDVAGSEPIHNEIGMSQVLHIEFVFSHQKFDCQDVIIGTVFPIVVKLRVVHMLIGLYVTETYTTQMKEINQKTTVKTMEIMDGPPVKGDNIPIRFFLGDCDIWPFQPYAGSPAVVEWYLRAQITGDDGKKYYKRLKAIIVRAPPPSLAGNKETE
jgi:vacuolar protein sorting-associated protein 26